MFRRHTRTSGGNRDIPPGVLSCAAARRDASGGTQVNHRYMRKSIWVVLVLLGASLRPYTATAAELVDSIVATVGREAILRSDIYREVLPVLDALTASNYTEAEKKRRFDEELRRKLDAAIESRILLREAEKLDVAVDSSYVENQIKAARDSFETEEEFIDTLRELGETVSDFRERKRKEIVAILMSRDKQDALRREIVISEEEIRQHYEEHQSDERYRSPERVRFQQILLLARRNTPARQEAVAKLEDLREQSINGADFGELAKEHSQEVGAAEGGLVGWGKRGEFIEAVDDVLFSMSLGEVSPVIEDQFGARILKVIDREDEQVVPLENVRTEIETILLNEAVAERYEKYIQDLRQRHRVRVFL